MRYWQITTRRLSKAAQKLEMDEIWHPFQSTPNSWYRVWRKKIVQRANFSTDSEAQSLLPLVQDLEPLPEMATVSGFREELNIQETKDGLCLTLPLGYPPSNLNALRRALDHWGFQLEEHEGLLYGVIPLASLAHAELVRAQTRQVALRLFFQSVTSDPSQTSINAAAEAMERMLGDT